MKKKISFGAILLALSLTSAQAQDKPLWLRSCTISPSGQTIAFTYMGDIYTVSAEGGRATQLTTNAGFDGYPVWRQGERSTAVLREHDGHMHLDVPCCCFRHDIRMEDRQARNI